MKGKNDFFFKKGRGYRALQLQASVVETLGRNRRLVEWTVGHGPLYKITKAPKLK
jgi:hypothetical protein